MKKLIITTMLLVACLVIAACSATKDETPTLNKSEESSIKSEQSSFDTLLEDQR